METRYKFSEPKLSSVYFLLKRKVGQILEVIPFEDVAQEIEIVNFLNPGAELYTLVKICRRSIRSLLHQMGYSRRKGKDLIDFSFSMSEQEIANWEILDEEYSRMTAREVLELHNVKPTPGLLCTLSKMCKGKMEEKEKITEIKNLNSPKMTSKDYRIANKFLRIRATQSGSCKPFSVIDNLPAVQAEKICSYLRKKHGVLMC